MIKDMQNYHGFIPTKTGLIQVKIVPFDNKSNSFMLF